MCSWLYVSLSLSVSAQSFECWTSYVVFRVCQGVNYSLINHVATVSLVLSVSLKALDCCTLYVIFRVLVNLSVNIITTV